MLRNMKAKARQNRRDACLHTWWMLSQRTCTTNTGNNFCYKSR